MIQYTITGELSLYNASIICHTVSIGLSFDIACIYL